MGSVSPWGFGSCCLLGGPGEGLVLGWGFPICPRVTGISEEERVLSSQRGTRQESEKGSWETGKLRKPAGGRWRKSRHKGKANGPAPGSRGRLTRGLVGGGGGWVGQGV